MGPDGSGSGLTLRQAVALPLLEWLGDRLATGQCRIRPVLALNGPVGAGKSTTARLLRELAPSLGLRLAVASIDDLYYPLAERLERMRGNPFRVSRVPPGSHDIPLLLERLGDWRAGGPLRLPRFDKRLADGQGDRAGETAEQADALVLEGWLMGCRPLGESGLAGRQAELLAWPLTPQERAWLPRWDRELNAYVPLWQACDGIWLLRPQRWTLPRRWRFQAEARQRRAGGSWLRGDELERLVRASLHSLPAPLYQDPLISDPWLPALPDGVPALRSRSGAAGRSTAGRAEGARVSWNGGSPSGQLLLGPPAKTAAGTGEAIGPLRSKGRAAPARRASGSGLDQGSDATSDPEAPQAQQNNRPPEQPPGDQLSSEQASEPARGHLPSGQPDWPPQETLPADGQSPAAPGPAGHDEANLEPASIRGHCSEVRPPWALCSAGMGPELPQSLGTGVMGNQAGSITKFCSDQAQAEGAHGACPAGIAAVPPTDLASGRSPLAAELPLAGVTLLNGRRGCLPWPQAQASLSSASSEIG